MLQSLPRVNTYPHDVNFDETFRVMSFNIRWEDGDPEHGWDSRRQRVASMMRFHRADLIGLQEPLKCQVDDLEELLPEFDGFGVGLDDGCEAGPHDMILWRKSRFQFLDSGFFYLSPTPHCPSKGWDAKYPRGTAWVKLLDRKMGKVFCFFNTHFDYHSKLARDESAFLLREKVSEISAEIPFLVAGDFNLFPELGGGETYQLLTDSEEELPGKPLIDAQKVALFPHHGPTGTWSGFKEPGQPGIKPDYIFVDDSVQVYLHGVLADSFDGQFPSDHLPVVADVIIP